MNKHDVNTKADSHWDAGMSAQGASIQCGVHSAGHTVFAFKYKITHGCKDWCAYSTNTRLHVCIHTMPRPAARSPAISCIWRCCTQLTLSNEGHVTCAQYVGACGARACMHAFVLCRRCSRTHVHCKRSDLTASLLNSSRKSGACQASTLAPSPSPSPSLNISLPLALCTGPNTGLDLRQ